MKEPNLTDECREIHLKLKACQPKNAKLEEPFTTLKADGSTPTPEELTCVALAPATIVEDPETPFAPWLNRSSGAAKTRL